MTFIYLKYSTNEIKVTPTNDKQKLYSDIDTYL